jgi:hypothetical protein
MKNTLQNRTNYIKHRHSDNACSKAKRRVNLKSSNSKTTKIDLLSKYVAILEANLQKKDGMKIIQKMQY